jgi:O-methyltransferase involved in polyketide biosynthesis
MRDGDMTDREAVELGAVQRTLFFPLTARARETGRKRPLLRDPKAAEIVRALEFDPAAYTVSLNTTFVVLRTMILDWWVSQFLDRHPNGTVVELGTGLNTRFERVDNGTVRWIDLDLPDTIEVRRRFFADTDRRRMIAASLLDEEWLADVERLGGPYFFVSDGVLVYLREDEVTGALARVAARFPGAMLAFDTYPQRTFEWEHRMAVKRNMPLWLWPVDDPRTLERLGLRLVESASVVRPPSGLLSQLPARYRFLLPLAAPLMGNGPAISLFQAPVEAAVT